MTLVWQNSSMDELEQQLNSITEEMDQAMVEAEQLLLDISNTGNISSNMDDTVPYEPPAPENVEEGNNSDIEVIVNEIPVIELLDSTADVGRRNSNVNNDRGHDSQDDDIIFVQQIQNDNPITIDLCNDTFMEPFHSTPNPSSRRRNRSIGTVIIDSDENPQRSVQTINDPAAVKRPIEDLLDVSVTSHNSSLPFKCPICLDNAIKKEPVSTLCGHVFCKKCIDECIRLTHKCPMCKKKLSSKNIHRIYLS